MVAPEMFYYILDGSVYQTPTLHAVFSARLVSLPHANQQKLFLLSSCLPNTIICRLCHPAKSQLYPTSSCDCRVQLHLMCFADLALQTRCMHNVQRAFLRLQSDLDPLVKPVQIPSPSFTSQSATPQQQKPSKRRLPDPDDMHATNRIIFHVLRKVWHYPFVCIQQGNQAQTCCILADV